MHTHTLTQYAYMHTHTLTHTWISFYYADMEKHCLPEVNNGVSLLYENLYFIIVLPRVYINDFFMMNILCICFQCVHCK